MDNVLKAVKKINRKPLKPPLEYNRGKIREPLWADRHTAFADQKRHEAHEGVVGLREFS